MDLSTNGEEHTHNLVGKYFNLVRQSMLDVLCVLLFGLITETTAHA